MPPMSFVGVVTKAGFMKKTATVTVSRWVIDRRTGKVGGDQSNVLLTALPYNNLILPSASPGTRNFWCMMREIVRLVLLAVDGHLHRRHSY